MRQNSITLTYLPHRHCTGNICRYQKGKQKPYIEDGQTTHKKNDKGCFWMVSNSCSTRDTHRVIVSWYERKTWTDIVCFKIPISYCNYVPQTKFGRHIVFAPFLIIIIIIIIIIPLSFFLSPKVCPTHLSEMPWSNLMKPCRNIICHVKLCLSGLETANMLKRPTC